MEKLQFFGFITKNRSRNTKKNVCSILIEKKSHTYFRELKCHVRKLANLLHSRSSDDWNVDKSFEGCPGLRRLRPQRPKFCCPTNPASSIGPDRAMHVFGWPQFCWSWGWGWDEILWKKFLQFSQMRGIEQKYINLQIHWFPKTMGQTNRRQIVTCFP